MKDVLNPYKGRLQYKTMKASKLYLKYNVHLFKIRLSHEMIIKWNFEEFTKLAGGVDPLPIFPFVTKAWTISQMGKGKVKDNG